MKRVAISLLVGMLAGCGGRSTIAPSATQQESAASVELITISGQVYAKVSWADPPIEGALVEVTGGDGSLTTAVTDDDGLYRLSLRGGNVSITASKDGYEAKTWQLTLLNDTVLNFGLIPN